MQNDLTAARRYSERHNRAAAQRLVLRVLDAVDRLTTQPNLGRPGRVPGTRELIVTGTPYIVPYRVKGQEVEVAASLPWRPPLAEAAVGRGVAGKNR